MSDLLKKSDEELSKKLEELRESLAKLRLKIEKPHEVKQLKKEIARVLTVMNMKERKNECE